MVKKLKKGRRKCQLVVLYNIINMCLLYVHRKRQKIQLKRGKINSIFDIDLAAKDVNPPKQHTYHHLIIFNFSIPFRPSVLSRSWGSERSSSVIHLPALPSALHHHCFRVSLFCFLEMFDIVLFSRARIDFVYHLCF